MFNETDFNLPEYDLTHHKLALPCKHVTPYKHAVIILVLLFVIQCWHNIALSVVLGCYSISLRSVHVSFVWHRAICTQVAIYINPHTFILTATYRFSYFNILNVFHSFEPADSSALFSCVDRARTHLSLTDLSLLMSPLPPPLAISVLSAANSMHFASLDSILKTVL